MGCGEDGIAKGFNVTNIIRVALKLYRLLLNLEEHEGKSSCVLWCFYLTFMC